MIRVKISNFIKNNKDKIQDLSKKIIIVAIVVTVATIAMSAFENVNNNEKKEKEILEAYKPKETVIKGKDISEKQYTIDSNIVDKFLKYCNSGNVEEAYKLLTDECKEELYPTIDEFKRKYYNSIFTKKREYNIQSWISTSEYTIYKIRYANSMLSTGTYEKENVFEDYITLKKKAEHEKLSIGTFIDSKECNKTTKTQELEITVVRKKTYLTDEEYEIKVKNKTNNVMLLDSLQDYDTIKLIAETGIEYGAYTNKLFIANLKINPGITKNITIRFKKNFTSNNKSEKINFSKVIRDYYVYTQDPENYEDVTNIKVKVED